MTIAEKNTTVEPGVLIDGNKTSKILSLQRVQDERCRFE